MNDLLYIDFCSRLLCSDTSSGNTTLFNRLVIVVQILKIVNSNLTIQQVNRKSHFDQINFYVSIYEFFFFSFSRFFGFVSRAPGNNLTNNQTHLFADLEQPAQAIVSFINKVMLSVSSNKYRQYQKSTFQYAYTSLHSMTQRQQMFVLSSHHLTNLIIFVHNVLLKSCFYFQQSDKCWE